LRCFGEHALGVDDVWSLWVEANGYLLPGPHRHFAFAIESECTGPRGYIDALTERQWSVGLYPHRHNETRCNRGQDWWRIGVQMDEQPMVGSTVLAMGKIARQSHKADLGREPLGYDDTADFVNLPNRSGGN
jgi:hypothetical protein